MPIRRTMKLPRGSYTCSRCGLAKPPEAKWCGLCQERIDRRRMIARSRIRVAVKIFGEMREDAPYAGDDEDQT